MITQSLVHTHPTHPRSTHSPAHSQGPTHAFFPPTRNVLITTFYCLPACLLAGIRLASKQAWLSLAFFMSRSIELLMLWLNQTENK